MHLRAYCFVPHIFLFTPFFNKPLAENPMPFKVGDESLPEAKRGQIAVVFDQDTTGFGLLVIYFESTLHEVIERELKRGSYRFFQGHPFDF